MPRELTHRYKIDEVTGCWVWSGFLSAAGYGPYRLYYRRLRGEYQQGLTLDHLCRNRACVNPDHLEPVTRRENTLRGIAPPAENARKTHCPRGHAYDIVCRKGYRWCRECKRQYFRKYRQLHKETLQVREQARHGRRRESANAGRRERYKRARAALTHAATCVVCGAAFESVTAITCSRACRWQLRLLRKAG